MTYIVIHVADKYYLKSDNKCSKLNIKALSTDYLTTHLVLTKLGTKNHLLNAREDRQINPPENDAKFQRGPAMYNLNRTAHLNGTLPVAQYNRSSTSLHLN